MRQRFVMLVANEHFSHLERLSALAERGQLAPIIDRCCRLHEVVTAMRDLEAGRVRGKVVVAITSPLAT